MLKLSKITLSIILGAGLVVPIHAAPTDDVALQNQNISTEDVEMVTDEILKGMNQPPATLPSSSENITQVPSESTIMTTEKKSTPTEPAIGYVPEESITRYTNSLKKSVDQKRVNQLYKQAYAKEISGASNQALNLLTRALHLSPQNEQVRLAKGRVQVKTREYGEAIKTLEPLCNLDSSQWQPWYWMGLAQLMMDQLSEAETSMDEALAREGTLATLWLHRALIAQENSDHNSALQLLAIAKDLDPQDPQILLNIAYSSEAIGDTNNAISAYRKFLTEAQKHAGSSQLRHKVLSHVSQMEIK